MDDYFKPIEMTIDETGVRSGRRDRFTAVFGILTAALLVIGFILQLCLPDKAYSATEKRMLEQFPVFSAESLLEGTYTSRAEEWMADQFPGRDVWMTVKTQMSLLLGQTVSHGVCRTRDGRLIALFDEPDAALMAENAAAVNGFVSAHPESHAFFMPVPTQAGMNAESLPANAPSADQNAFIDAFCAALSGNVTVLDVRPALSAAKSAGTKIYYATDHHWTTDGAYAAYRAVCGPLGWAEERFERSVVCGSFVGSLSASGGFRLPVSDEIALYRQEENGVLLAVLDPETGTRAVSCYDAGALEGDDPYEVFFGGNFPRLTIETSADTDRTLLVFKDSYANCFLPFAAGQYRRIDIIDPRYYAESASRLFATESYTDILFLYNADTLSKDTSLRKVLGQE